MFVRAFRAKSSDYQTSLLSISHNVSYNENATRKEVN